MSRQSTRAAPAQAASVENAPRPWLARLLPKLLISLALGALFAFLVHKGGIPLLPPAVG